MDSEGLLKAGSESQDSDEPAPPGISKADFKKTNVTITKPEALSSKPATTVGFKLTPSLKGVENAKKRLRAFSIQKKTPLTPVTVPKGPSGGSATVFIGKLNNVKVAPKPEDVEQKKPPKPPKPGQGRKILQDSYTELQKRTLTEIEDMKRKMELVELGIPLGLICPSSGNDKAMPTKAMPPIKTFLDPAKLDEIIREAKKAKAEGREFKFDYQKILPDYDNPFQRKKEELERARKMSSEEREREVRRKLAKDRDLGKERRKSDKYEKESRRYSSHRKDDKDKRKDDRDKYREKPKEKTEEKKDDKKEKDLTPVVKKKVEKVGDKGPTKETDVNLSDYLVCDSWSLENDDKSNMSPKVDDKIKNIPIPKENKPKETTIEVKKEITESPQTTPIRKMEKLKPVMDSFKFEIDDELLDMFDENSGLEKFATKTRKRDDIFESPIDMKIFDFDQNTKESADALTDDTFLESVINEIKQEDMSDEGSQDKGLVEYDSPSKESSSPPIDSRLSVTPELDDRMFMNLQSSRSDYSDGYRSTESGYKSTESGYKSSVSYKSGESKGDNYRLSMEKEVEQMNKSTVDSLETWSFVLKICQPLLFRHDRNKCYRETRSVPKIWFTENPKLCSCVKDRAVVYEELETCKMTLVDRVYGCDQIPEVELPKSRTWYPRFANCLTENSSVPPLVPASDWEADDSQTETPHLKEKRRSTTPVRSEEIYLDREYQRFMQAVWPEATESKSGTPRSTTPVRQETRKKKTEDKDSEDKKKAKKMKLSSEGWSQESDIEEEVEKSKKVKVDKVKIRKRKHSSSVSDSDDAAKKRKKTLKKAKEDKNTKAKLAKRRRLSKKYLKKLKEKQRKKKKLKQALEDEDLEKENRRKEKKLRKKRLQKKKKAQKKKRARAKSSSSSSSSSSTSSSSSETDSEAEKRKKKKKSTEVKKKKRKKSSSDSAQSEELFDVNILNNIKTERLTDDEKNQSLVDFSPRRQKPREIINVKELQNDFVGNNNIHIKQEIEETVHRDEVVKMADIELQEKEFATEKAPEVPDVFDEPVVPEEQVQEVQEIKQEVSFKEIPLPEMVQTEQHRDTEQIAAHRLPDNTTLSTAVDKTIPEPSPLKKQVDINKPEPSIPEPSIPESSIPESLPIDKEPQEHQPPQITPLPEESNLSQCSSQESTTSKDIPYEKDDSHLRPSSQNSNYSFNDVISASHNYQKDEEDKFQEYEQGNYEMYEQLAMAYQSDVAKQSSLPTPSADADPFFVSQVSQKIETVVRMRSRGEIKCDWRAGDEPTTPVPSSNHRPSRWGLKPCEVNIVLTGGDDYSLRSEEPVYQIQTIANRSENNSSGSYDEAYEDMYGASDRLQYGDCFNTDIEPATAVENGEAIRTSSLDQRIDQALRNTVLGDVAKDSDEVDADKDGPEKGILVIKAVPESRGAKRVSFADGYKPGQDSDVEDPPVKKKKKPRRYGCAWPCAASHPDHVPLWDALPPPPPPPGSPPRRRQLLVMQPPSMLQAPNIMQQPNMMQQPPNMLQQQQQMLQSQPPPNMLQQPPQMLQQQQQMLQQPPQMLQQQPQMLQQPLQMLQQQPQMLQQQSVKSMMPTPPFSMPQKLEPSVSLPNFLPPEPPPGLLGFP